MRAEAFVLPEPFARRATSFVCAATGSDRGEQARGFFANSTASASARSHNAKRRTTRRALCQTRRARRPEHTDTSSLDRTRESLNQTHEKPSFRARWCRAARVALRADEELACALPFHVSPCF